MPEISRFLGIIIAMNFSDHNPPHFHVRYNEYEASIRIKDFGLMIGAAKNIRSCCRMGKNAPRRIDALLGRSKKWQPYQNQTIIK